MNSIPDWKTLPWAWGGPAGRAKIRVQPEDFRVVELPIIEPTGDGEHSWVWVRKHGSNTEWVARQLAAYADVSVSSVGYAGMKDRDAVTEQWFSVHLPGKETPDWSGLKNDEFKILRDARHNRKLKRGGLRGNHFELLLRSLEADPDQLLDRLQQVKRSGFPNYFGPQRFGRNGRNLVEAERLFKDPRKRIPRNKRSIYLSAARSALFNHVLIQRVLEHHWDQIKIGEAVQLEGKSACFVIEEIDDDISQRLETLAIHPTGPLWGKGEWMPVGDARVQEQAQLTEYETWQHGLERLGLEHARRALRVKVADLEWSINDDSTLFLTFSLPSGAYATSLIRELVTLDTNDE